MDLQKSTLALLAGFGLVAIFGFFYLFMRDKPSDILMISILLIILAALMMLFVVFDKLRFSPASITDRNSNLVAGLLFGVIFLVLLMTYTEVAAGEVFDAILVTILTALTAFTVFLLLFSLGMED
jgi:hypothetical protein